MPMPTMILPDPEAPPARAPRSLWAAVIAGVAALAAIGYWRTGTPNYAERAERAEAAARQAAAASAAETPGSDAQHLDAMVSKLVLHLQSKPDDGQGWAMLGRARMMQGRADDAVAAFQKAVPLREGDGRLLADYAEALATKNGNTLIGEPTRLLERALALDARSPKALALSGAAAFDRRDFAAAVKLWEQLLTVSPPDADYVRQVKAGIADARQQGKLGPGEGAAPAAAAAASISGTVTLADALRANASPEDTLFVFARAAEGPRMPLALLKKQVKDLPFTFTLDDSMAMNPAMKLSAFPRVVVVARISKSGQATPQPGDVSGESAPVGITAQGVRVELREVVAK